MRHCMQSHRVLPLSYTTKMTISGISAQRGSHPVKIPLNASRPRTNGRFLHVFFLYAFSQQVICTFWFRSHWNLLIRVRLTITQHWFNNAVVPSRRHAIAIAKQILYRVFVKIVKYSVPQLRSKDALSYLNASPSMIRRYYELLKHTVPIMW